MTLNNTIYPEKSTMKLRRNSQRARFGKNQRKQIASSVLDGSGTSSVVVGSSVRVK